MGLRNEDGDAPGGVDIQDQENVINPSSSSWEREPDGPGPVTLEVRSGGYALL